MALLELPVKNKQKKEEAPEDALTGTPGTRFSRHLILCLVGLVMLYPLLWLISSSWCARRATRQMSSKTATSAPL